MGEYSGFWIWKSRLFESEEEAKKSMFKGWSDLDFCSWMVKEVGVAAVPGSSFFKDGTNNYIRLHFARSEESLREATNRLMGLNKYL